MNDEESKLNHATHERTKFMNGLESEVGTPDNDFSKMSVQELAHQYSSSDYEGRTLIFNYVMNNLDVKDSGNFIILMNRSN